MSETQRRCQLNHCNRAASAFCFCCNKNVCTRHFTDHMDAVKLQIDPLTNEVNTMVENIQGLTIEQITGTSFPVLQQWRIGMHQLIEEIFMGKSQEIKNLINMNKGKFIEHKKQQFESIMKIQDDIKQLIKDGDVTFEQIQLLKNKLANVETNLTSFRTNFLSVNARVVAQGLVVVSSNLNQTPANQPPPQQQPIPTPMAAQNNSAFGTPTDARGPLVAGSARQQRRELRGAIPPSFSFRPPPAAGFGNNAPSFGMNQLNPGFQLNNNGQK